MCNIAGYVGTQPAAPLLIKMMRQQEGLCGGYYSGIATLHEGKIYYAKLTGDVRGRAGGRRRPHPRGMAGEGFLKIRPRGGSSAGICLDSWRKSGLTRTSRQNIMKAKTNRNRKDVFFYEKRENGLAKRHCRGSSITHLGDHSCGAVSHRAAGSSAVLDGGAATQTPEERFFPHGFLKKFVFRVDKQTLKC